MATRKAKSPARSAGKKKAPAKRARGKLAPGKTARGIDAAEVPIALDSPDVVELAKLVRDVGGAPIGAYREPLGGLPLMLASLPLSAVQPTPFQRDLSPTHAKRLAQKIDETAAFLDPLIVVRGEDGRFWTPNGRHRLAAGKVLGLKQITCLISPNDRLAYRILALNTEKAHNLRDRSLEVIRMARSLLKKVDRFSERTLPVSLREREGFAARLLEIDGLVKKIIAALQAKGFKSPYLRNYVVARINPVRFHKVKKGDTKPPMPLAE